ncbi:unnamed protein product [Caenorhabditis auriculariae]|uniref:Serpentine receptor class gamma n=1 Tax=Caenorhabditis auriculariae TaxID=2777116 RepID=A0A8S1GS61_9PELO|nr:unnamed protein product [Caenorhabditis auriculariae]
MATIGTVMLVATTTSAPASSASPARVYHWQYLRSPENYVYLVFIINYIFIIGVVLKSKKNYSRSAFFMIFVASGVFDIMLALSTIGNNLYTYIGFGDDYWFLLMFMKSLSGTNWYTHLWGSFLMSLNQLSALMYPTKFSLVWTRKKTAGYLAFGFIGSFVLDYHLFLNPAKFQIGPDGFAYYKGRVYSLGLTRWVSMSITGLYVLLNGAVSVTTMVLIRYKTSSDIRKLIQEKSLVFFACLSTLLTLLELIYDCLVEVYGDFTEENANVVLLFIYNNFSYYFFFLAVQNGVTIIIFSKTLRDELLSLVVRKKSQELPSSTIFIVAKSQENKQ